MWVQTDSQIWTVYLDTCCLSRLFDIQTQPRVHQETQAIEQILTQIQAGHWAWISSNVLMEEVEQTPDPQQRAEIMDWLTNTYQTVSAGLSEVLRGKQLEVLGFTEMDALHIACAESGNVDIFLTTDDGILRRAKRNSSNLYVQVENPYVWLQTGEENEYIGNDR